MPELRKDPVVGRWVIIETNDHTKELSELSEAQIENVLWAFRDRVVDLKNDNRFRYILIFKNHGENAGASLEHSHTQLVATPIIPKVVTEELDGALQHYRMKERCVFCDMIEHEQREGKRIVSENAHFVSFEPFAPRFPFETWILPRSHISAIQYSHRTVSPSPRWGGWGTWWGRARDRSRTSDARSPCSFRATAPSSSRRGARSSWSRRSRCRCAARTRRRSSTRSALPVLRRTSRTTSSR